ncbi:MAG: glycosyltransferase [Bacteroidota bacterium]
MILQLIIIILSSVYLIHLLTYFYFWNIKSIKKNILATTTNEIPFITIILVARNEEEHIQKCIEHLVAQNYPNNYFEIILVDDFSEDKTLALVTDLNHPFIQCISLANILSSEFSTAANKKRGISLAIKQAKGSIIACSDADAFVSKNWLTQIRQTFENKDIQFSTGPVLYINNNNLLEKFQTADMYSMIGMSAASIEMNQPYMCNGANLAYRKKAFELVDGYKNIDHLATGDDVLLMHKINEHFGGKAIYYNLNEDALVYTYAEKNWNGFLQQRTRWVSKSAHYKNGFIKMTLAFMYVFHLCLLLWPICILCQLSNWYLYLIVIGSKTIIDTVFIYSVSQKLNKPFNIFLMPIFEFIYICYISIIGLTASFGNYTWKNRRLKI